MLCSLHLQMFPFTDGKTEAAEIFPVKSNTLSEKKRWPKLELVAHAHSLST